MMNEIISYAFLGLSIATGIVIVVRFRGSPGAVLGGIAFGIWVATDITRRVLHDMEMDWWEYNQWFALSGLGASGCLLAALITGRVHGQSPSPGTRGDDPVDGRSPHARFDAGRPMTVSRILFSFTGRIDRATFCGVWISMFVLNVVLGAMLEVLAGGDPTIAYASLLWLPFAVWMALAIQAKRWHDRGRSAWMILINLVPILGLTWTVAELAFLRGTIGANQYGPDPLVPAAFSQRPSPIA